MQRIATEKSIPVFPGGHAGFALERLSEMALRAEGQDRRDLGDAHIGIFQHCLGGLKTFVEYVFRHGHARFLLEQHGQIGGVQADGVGQDRHGDALMQMFIDIIDTQHDLFGVHLLLADASHALSEEGKHFLVDIQYFFDAVRGINPMDV